MKGTRLLLSAAVSLLALLAPRARAETQRFQPPAARKNVDAFVVAAVTVLWNVEKKGR